MFERKVRFQSEKDVEEFVNAAHACDFDIDVKSGALYVDAKSILGVMCLGLYRDLTVKYGSKNNRFEGVLNKFCVA